MKNTNIEDNKHKLEYDVDYVFTLKDQNILDEKTYEINNNPDILENTNLEFLNKPDNTYDNNKYKYNQIYRNINDEEEDKNEIKNNQIQLDENGEISQNKNELEKIKEKLLFLNSKKASNKLSNNIINNTENKIKFNKEFYNTKEEFKKRNKKKKMVPSTLLLSTELEEIKEITNNKNNISNDIVINEEEEKMINRKQNRNNDNEYNEGIYNNNDEDYISSKLNAINKKKTIKKTNHYEYITQIKKSTSEQDTNINSQANDQIKNSTSNISTNINNTNITANKGGVEIISDYSLFLKNISIDNNPNPSQNQSSEPNLLTPNDLLSLKDVKNGTTSIVNISLPNELTYIKSKLSNESISQSNPDPQNNPSNITVNEELEEPPTGKGVSIALEIFKKRGLICDEEEFGRYNDKSYTTNDYMLNQENLDKQLNKNKDFDIVYRDDMGRKLKPKEMARYQSHIFHNEAPSIKKMEKMIKRDQKEVKLKSSSTLNNAKTLQYMKYETSKNNKPFAVLGGQKPSSFL